MTANPQAWRSRSEAARRIRELHRVPCEASTLAKEAHYGSGPVYRVVGGRAMYLDADIDTWALTKIGPPVRKACDSYAPEPSSKQVAAG